MRNRIDFRFLTGLLVLSAVFGLANCGSKGSEAANNSMMVVYTTGTAFILAEGKSELPTKVGMIVKQNDIIRTESGTVDLQTRSGSAVRIREMTKITIAALSGGTETKINMDHGGLLANVKKAGSGENFSVVTPTAIAGVRGTTFSVEVGEDSRSSVRVLDGSVAMKPRVVALEKMDAQQIKADPNLQKLADIQAKSEVVLEKETQGRLDPKTEASLIEANKADANATPGKVSAIAASIDSAKPVTTEKVEITTREIIDSRTLVAVDGKVMEQAVAGGQESVAAQEISKQREQKTEQLLGQIMDDASRNKLNSEKEIQQHYNKLELVVLKNGDKIRGAVIAQTGNSIVVHSPEGVKKILRSDLDYQEPLF